MLSLRPSTDRGHFDHGWLNTYHTFSFADYFDPRADGLSRVAGDERGPHRARQGFGMHGHRDMEIVTLVLSGALEHRDSLGNGEVLRPGELQRMTAGSGIRHSEFNPSADEPVHLYQIWLLPRAKRPAAELRAEGFRPGGRQNRWQLVASPDGAEGSLTIQTDARILLANLSRRQPCLSHWSPAAMPGCRCCRERLT